MTSDARTGSALPLSGSVAERPRVEVALHQPMRRLRDHDPPGLGGLLEPGRDVRRVAHGRVVHAEVVADRADDHEARVQPLADLEGDAAPRWRSSGLVERRSDPQGSVDRALSMILVRDRSTEQRHDAVTKELVHGALVAVDLGEHQLEDPGHEAMDFFGIQPLGQRRETRDVDEQDGDLLPLPFKGALGGEDLLGEVLGSVRLRGDVSLCRRRRGR